MNTYDFEVMLTVGENVTADAFLDSVEERLFEVFEGDVTPAFSAGVPVLLCTTSADTFEEAVRGVVTRVSMLGLMPVQVSARLHGAALAA